MYLGTIILYWNNLFLFIYYLANIEAIKKLLTSHKQTRGTQVWKSLDCCLFLCDNNRIYIKIVFLQQVSLLEITCITSRLWFYKWSKITNSMSKFQLNVQMDSERILGPIYQWRGSYPLLSICSANHGTVFPSNIHEQDICSPWSPLSLTTDSSVFTTYFFIKYNSYRLLLPFERYKSAMFQ